MKKCSTNLQGDGSSWGDKPVLGYNLKQLYSYILTLLNYTC